ncbi:MAG: type IV toxin-antitoxin system AbiEi family antitoxin [Polaromonas sp.]|uniref:type IV toxin-antitoxin system AbiEi family antitoxin n=1 Tax=Polaromonas sp. TaxID=1869339 RepID=UPI0027345C43|nr:type IV toxin-antitoxin system AbiEi family antitoxin [Polaromonas sp.]MDP3798559.1 type IV toxin-antitoxin system AbiEi family antitoxin [Polaromonas sp.]
MDKPILTPEHMLLDAAVEAATGLGVTVQVVQRDPQLGRARADALVRVTHGGQEVLYAVEVRRTLHPATLGAALQQLERLGQQAMLVTDYVAPALADELKARHIAFLDTAGNAYFEQPPLLIWVKGQKPAAKPAAQTAGRAFQPTGLQVLFTLLCNPQAVNRPYRELAEMAGVAHGTVGWVIPDLQQLGYVRDLKGKRGTRRLFELERLLDEWATTYARALRPRTLLGRYYVPTLEGWKDWPLAEHGALWGGEPAAAVLTDYLRPGVLTLYADKVPGLLAARQKFMKEPEPGHTAVVEVRKRFWNFPGDPRHNNLVPPLLVYADLLATGDARCIETAKMIYDAYVARPLTEG